jgi:DNA-damage-inducible protein J
VSDAVRLLLTKVARQGAALRAADSNATTIEAMKEARKGPKLPRFATVNDLMADLHAAD